MQPDWSVLRSEKRGEEKKKGKYVSGNICALCFVATKRRFDRFVKNTPEESHASLQLVPRLKCVRQFYEITRVRRWYADRQSNVMERRIYTMFRELKTMFLFNLLARIDNIEYIHSMA